MSRTLNLVDLLLQSGRHLLNLGRTLEAQEVLTRLADFRQLSRQVIEETQALLAEAHLLQKNYSKARRHLTAAIALQPLKADYHHMMATAIEEDDRADLRRAEMYYEQAVQSEPGEASYWADYGTYLFRLGKDAAGLKAIRKAFHLGIEDAAIVERVAEALRGEEFYEEAGTKLRIALFHNHGAEPFRRLWQDHRFCVVSAEQRRQKQESSDAQGPATLPFAAAEHTGKYVNLGTKTIRFDSAEPLKEPKAPVRLPFRNPPKG